MGEIVLKAELEAAGLGEIADGVTSAGVSSEEHGNPVDSRAARVLTRAGYHVPAHHRAHRITDAELCEADLLLAMTAGHARQLRRRLEDLSLPTTKIQLWRSFSDGAPIPSEGAFGHDGPLGEQAQQGSAARSAATRASHSQSADFYQSHGNYDVPDPWYGGEADFLNTLSVVKAGAQRIVRFVQNN